jgi:hypothetical protein
MAEAEQKKKLLDLRLRLGNITRVSWRDLATTLGPVLLIAALTIFIALHYVRPVPPNTIVFSAGPAGSKFATVAESYKKILAKSGIELTILPSEGALDNLHRLADPSQTVDAGFVQSGIAGDTDISNLASLGSMFYEPVIIFYRSPKPYTKLSDFHGQRITIGREGSGTRFLALTLLKANGIEPQGSTSLLNIEGTAAMDAILARQVDAIFLAGDSASPANIRQMLHAPGIREFDFVQADAYVRRFRYLSKLEMPPGSFDLGDNLPSTSFAMLAPTVEIVARGNLHPALSDLLIEAAREVHGHAGLLQKAGEFPAPRGSDYPVSDDAKRYYKSGKGLAYRYLPFGLASLANRILAIVVPIIVVLVPGLQLVPKLYGWRVSARIYRRYGELMAVERASLDPLGNEERTALLDRLREIESGVIALKVPGAYAEQIYVLRAHIKFVYQHLAKPLAGPVTESGVRA